jgi:predicted Zn-dependent protease
MVVALRQNEPALAEQLAVQVLEKYPDSLLALQAITQARLAQGRAEDAIAGLKGVFTRHGDPGLDSLYARALNLAGRQREAIDHLKTALERPPPTPQLFLELANLLSGAGDAAHGIAVLDRGLQVLPDDPVLMIGLGYLYLRQDNRPEARNRFEAAHAASPHRHDALIALASVLALDGDFKRAAELFHKALRIQPKDLTTEINLGKCLLESGLRSEGEAVLRATVRGSTQVAGRVIMALAHASHGRFFLKTKVALDFLGLAVSK